jgi:tetratricopeptide (TPR) repeat protein
MDYRWLSLFVVIHIAGLSDASGQSLDQQRCFAPGPGDDTIGGCTALIQSGRETPENLAKAFSSRGFAYGSRGQYDRAIEDYDQAIRFNPNYAEAFDNRGLVYLLADQYDRAIDDFDHAIGLNPNDARALVGRGAGYARKGVTACRLASLPPCALAMAEYDRAIDDFDQAILLNPNDAMVALAYGERSVVKSAKGDFAGAAADLAKANQLNPSVGK